MNKHGVESANLTELGLSASEGSIYLELLKQPATHAQLSSLTNINRTTLYRLVNKLEKRGIITRRMDDNGTFLIAADPSTLEVGVVDQENRAKRQRMALTQLLPALEAIHEGYAADFAVHTYEGAEGFKRMLWHELKAKGECLTIGGATLEEFGVNRRWAEKHRQLTAEAGYRIRELSNPGVTPEGFTDNQLFLRDYYQSGVIPREILPINHLTTIYNDTVAIYNVYEGRSIGLEIISKSYAQTARSVFENFWKQAKLIE
jgi:hypothetical protein